MSNEKTDENHAWFWYVIQCTCGFHLCFHRVSKLMHVTNLAIFYWLSAYELLMSLRRLVDSLDWRTRKKSEPLCSRISKMKQQTHDKLNVGWTRKKSEPQMGLEPTTLHDLVGCSNHWATGDFMVSKGQFMGLDWNRIMRLHSGYTAK